MLARPLAVARRGGLAACLTAVAGGMAAPVAHADIVAAVEIPATPELTSNRVDTDLALVNAATGAKTQLPAGVNTPAVELHPSLSADGNRLVFQRIDRSAGTNRIVVTDLRTGQQADLFDVFEAQQDPPTTPAMVPSGTEVITGRQFQQSGSSQFVPSWKRTGLANFATGPFPKTQSNAGPTSSSTGRTVNELQLADGSFASEVRPDAGGDAKILVMDGNGVGSAQKGGFGLHHPALSGGPRNIVVYERDPAGFQDQTQLAYRAAASGAIGGATESVFPQIVNAPGSDQLRPTFTSDGRFLAFIRSIRGGPEDWLLFVFDTQSQTFLNPNGIDLFPVHGHATDSIVDTDGNIALKHVLVLSSTASLTSGGALSTRLLVPTGVGILVQRIVGHHKLLGRTVPTLRTVGRVPFGFHRAGRFRTRWNLKIGGKRLKAGRYLVTIRATTRTGRIRDLGRSFEIRIR